MRLLSIVIPCYNQGHFLKETLASLEACDNSLFEIIIVNDGSTDEFTNQYLRELSQGGYQVIFQENTGLGQARNNGIARATGQYILPLDSDNKIRPAYISLGIEILETRPDISVVYGNAAYFGAQSGILRPGPFNLQRLMLGNYIDACALIRKSAMAAVGYYENMPIMGFEDWDLWLRMSFAGAKFHYIDEIMFDYRVSPNSMIRSLNANIQKQNELEDYITSKYADKLSFDAVRAHFVYRFKKRPFRFLYRLFLERFFPNYYHRLIKENKLYKGGLYDRI